MKDETETIACTEQQQIRIITEHFKKMLAPESGEDLHLKYSPQPMETPFTGEEIREVVNRMKNEKSAGPDELEIELIKYASTEIHNEIANIFDTLASTGEKLQELILGVLRALQKPGKERGPAKNLRPIILLSIIRKILTICMLDRILNRLKSHIPYKQAAYQPGRSTTENEHAIKLLVEKAIQENYHIYLLLVDMSKAFDTVNRRILFEHLKEILNGDEMHILGILTSKPELTVKVGSQKGESFVTNTGIMQGDCLSAILFIFYLAKCLEHMCQTQACGPNLARNAIIVGLRGNIKRALELAHSIYQGRIQKKI